MAKEHHFVVVGTVTKDGIQFRVEGDMDVFGEGPIWDTDTEEWEGVLDTPGLDEIDDKICMELMTRLD